MHTVGDPDFSPYFYEGDVILLFYMCVSVKQKPVLLKGLDGKTARVPANSVLAVEVFGNWSTPGHFR
jgi:hypothetical protein